MCVRGGACVSACKSACVGGMYICVCKCACVVWGCVGETVHVWGLHGGCVSACA